MRVKKNFSLVCSSLSRDTMKYIVCKPLIFNCRWCLRKLNVKYGIFTALCTCIASVSATATSFASREIGLCVNESRLLPDLIDTVPQQRLFIEYGKHRVDFGTYLSPLVVEFPPSNVQWLPTENKFYTLILTDPDYPTPENPHSKEWQHWIVGNIPAASIVNGSGWHHDGDHLIGGNITEGEVLTDYIGIVSHQRFGTPHRYVFLLFEHDQKVKFKEAFCNKVPDDFYRAEFSTREFAKKYNLGEPLGINYFHNTRDPRRIEDNKLRRDDSDESEEGDPVHHIPSGVHELVLTTPKRTL